MNILSVDWLRNESNASLPGHLALEKYTDFIDKVEAGPLTVSLDYSVVYHFFQKGIAIPLLDPTRANRQIKKLVAKNTYDVIWIDKRKTIDKSILLYIYGKYLTQGLLIFLQKIWHFAITKTRSTWIAFCIKIILLPNNLTV